MRLATVLLAGLIAAAAPVQAEDPPCWARDDLRAALQNMGEVPIAIGLTSPTSVLEVYAAADGTFTVVETAPDGVSCLLRAGFGFEFTTAPPPIEGTPG